MVAELASVMGSVSVPGLGHGCREVGAHQSKGRFKICQHQVPEACWHNGEFGVHLVLWKTGVKMNIALVLSLRYQCM